MPIEPGTYLGRYKIVSQIGVGAMGTVFRALDTQLGRPVAIKILSDKLALDDSHLHRFSQEARAASALNHLNIVTIYEVGNEHATHFIVTELIQGQTLRRRLKRARTGLNETLDISLQICAALAAAHKAGIIHRDLKPENV